MADQRTKRRYLSRLGVGIMGLLLVCGFVWFVRTMMASKTVKQGRQVQIVQLIPPPPEKTDEPLPKDEPQPAPNDEPPPSEPMGIDAQGSAGEDAFGLAARHGGSDLVGGNGSAAFAWYTNRLKDAVVDKLSSDARLGAKKFSLTVQVWIAADGRIKQVKLASTTGNHELDERIESALSSLTRLSEAPPLEMPQPISLKIVSRT